MYHINVKMKTHALKTPKAPPLWPSRQDYGRSWVESKNRLTSQFSGRDSLQGKQAFIITGHGWVPKTGFFPTFLWSRLPQAKQVRTENPWILHFREKIFRRGRPLRGSRSHRKAPQAEIFFKNKQRWSKKAKKRRPASTTSAGLLFLLFCFTFNPASHENPWILLLIPRQTRVKRASNARQTRVKRAANAHQVVLKFSAPNIGGDLSRSEILNTWY